MKKLLLLSLLFVAFAATTTLAQVPRRVLVEEFTSSTCPPCRATDPIMEQFEEESFNDICVLKWHVNWPSPGNDPFYLEFKGSSPRSTQYYGNVYAPFVFFGGSRDTGLSASITYIETLKSIVEDVKQTPSPYSITVSQSIIADSVIVNLSVKAEGSVMPSETDLRLAVVIAERFAVYTGTNGAPSHSSVVRTVIPGLTSSGAISTSAQVPAFTLAVGETKTYRLATKIGSTWNTDQIMTVAFIQSVDSKEVFQSAWTLPANVTIKPQAAGYFFVGEGEDMSYEVKNHSANAVTVNVDFVAPTAPANWDLKIDGLDVNNSLTLAANETKLVTATSASGIDAKGVTPYSIYIRSNDDIGLTGTTNTAFGAGNKNVIINSGISASKANAVLRSYANAGYDALMLTEDDFLNGFYESGWDRFKTVTFILPLNANTYFTNTAYFDRALNYLNAGGNLLMTTHELVGMYYDASVSQSNNIFLTKFEETFGITPSESNDNSSSWTSLAGEPNDVIANGISSSMSGMSTTQRLTPLDEESKVIFKNENGDNVGVRSETASGKSVLLSFGLDNFSSKDSTVRTSTVKRIMDWFYGATSVKISENATATTISNYPNPASLLTTFTYSLTERSLVTLSVYDVMGREVASIITNQMQDKGTYESDLDVSKLSAGSYIYKLNVGGNMLTGTLNVVK